MKVLSSIYAALTYVRLSVKINCVLMRGTNETEIGEMETERMRERKRERERMAKREEERKREREEE